MQYRDLDESVAEIFTDTFRLSRRDFLRATAAASSGLMLGTGISSLSGCGHHSDWRPKSFRKVLFHNFQLFDGIENRLQKNLLLLVENDTIQGIERGDLSSYRDYKMVNLKGKTLLPGLIDNHVHMTVPFMYSINLSVFQQMNQQIVYNFRNCIMQGVTTVRDVGGFPGKINRFRELSDRNEIPGPRVISSLSPIAAREGDRLGAPEKAPYFKNPVITWILGGNYAERPTNVREIQEACERMISLGAQWLKTLHQEHSYSYHTRKLPNHTDEGYRAILDIGERHGIRCALHEPFLSGFRKGVALGFHTLEHMPMDAVIPKRDIEGFIEKGMAIMPTVMAYGDVFVKKDILALIASRGDEYLMPEAVKQMSLRLKKLIALEKRKLSVAERKKLRSDPQYIRDMFPNILKNVKRLHAMGATIGAGSDIGGTFSGFFGRFVDELKHYVSAGISNYDTLRMATAVNARIIGMHDRIGTIEKGKAADMIAVEGNPLADIDALNRIGMVMRGGIFMNSSGIELQ